MGNQINLSGEDEVFVQVSKRVVHDSRLSFKALGIFTYLRDLHYECRKNRVTFTVESLAAKHREGVDAVKSGIRELKEAGHLVISRARDKGGKYSGWSWRIRLGMDPKPKVENPPFGESTQPVTESGKTVGRKNRRTENPLCKDFNTTDFNTKKEPSQTLPLRDEKLDVSEPASSPKKNGILNGNVLEEAKNYDDWEKEALAFYGSLSPDGKRKFESGALGMNEFGSPPPARGSSGMKRLLVAWYEELGRPATDADVEDLS